MVTGTISLSGDLRSLIEDKIEQREMDGGWVMLDSFLLSFPFRHGSSTKPGCKQMNDQRIRLVAR